MTADVAVSALEMAKARGYVAEGAIFHSNRDAQYTGRLLAGWASENGVRLSVGRTGSCHDNAVAESFFATLKNEMYSLRPCPTRAEARSAVVGFIEGYYNRMRPTRRSAARPLRARWRRSSSEPPRSPRDCRSPRDPPRSRVRNLETDHRPPRRELGTMEGTCAHVGAARLKGQGRSWSRAGAEAVCLIRCALAAGRTLVAPTASPWLTEAQPTKAAMALPKGASRVPESSGSGRESAFRPRSPPKSAAISLARRR